MQSLPFDTELPWLMAGVSAYGVATLASWHAAWRRRSHASFVLASLLAAVSLLAVAIALRWMRTGYGPFLTLFEVLLSNLFSLGLIYLLVYWRYPLARPGAVVVLPLLLLLSVWLRTVSPEAGQLPATYLSAWLWVHVGVGKLFLGLCLAAVGIAGVLLLRKLPGFGQLLGSLPADEVLDVPVWRFMSVAFIFHSLMLIAGAVWAQVAWGRFWAWDPLETWAFVTWLALGLSLHARLTWRIPLWSGWLMVLGVFCLAFLTFFGVPFSSLGPHKGIL